MRFVKVGSPLRVRARGVAMEYLGKVDLIYPLVEQDGRKIRVRIVLENKDFLLLGGMVVSGIFEVKKGSALVIPKDALMLEGEKAYVFVEKEGGTYVKRVVKTGEIGPETVEVLDGLSAGEKVVTQANFLLDSDSKIRAQIER
jgi:Cu(I)/Ag(I) efflux system membrane fusion protein